MLRWVLGGIACLIAGLFMLSRYYADVPALAQLATFTGNVDSADVEIQRTRRMQSQLLAVRIRGASAVYYPERFPEFDRIVGTIKPGDRITVWVDVGQNNLIWQLEKEGERLAAYDQTADAQRSHNRNNALFGILFIVVGLATLVVMMWQWRTGSSAGS